MSINPADCDRATVYTGECRNFADTEWIRFDSGRRRSPDARDGNTWLIDVGYGSFWMADDKVRNLVPLVPAPTGGQWTCDDLPSLIVNRADGHWALSAGLRHDLAEWLNAHHPKPQPYDQGGVRGADSLLYRAERERDAAAARAEAAERVLRERDEQEDDATRAACERAEQAERDRDEAIRERRQMEDDHAKMCREWRGMDARVVEAERERDKWKARAEQAEQLIPAYAMLDIWMALGRDSIHFDDWYDEHGYADAWAELTSAVREGRTAPAVTRDEIEKAVRSAFKVWGYDRATGQEWEVLARIRPLFDRVEAEQDVDPVEEGIARLIDPDAWMAPAEFAQENGHYPRWSDQNQTSRREESLKTARAVAAHVLGQEATR